MNAKPELLKKADVIIDALLGIGFRGVLKEPYRSIIEQVNQTNAQVIAVDLPSGIPAETNDAETIAVKADYTYIIEAPKPSTFIERYADYYGERSEEHTSELQSRGHLVCRLLLEKKKGASYSRSTGDRRAGLV